ncbi:MAG: 2-oxo acid dehydrogenase subunit E2, partial [Clostridia bacterium]|nr:2-oxo acid dehydrogenase subunit E2 [Clostridia bacterium]
MSRKVTGVTTFGIQRKIVANMTAEGWREAPHCSYLFEPDLTGFVEKFNVFSEELKKEGKKITLNTVVMKAICEALKASPNMNAHLEFNKKLVRGTIKTFDQIDVSMPWILPNGKMMTITMKDMGNRSLGNIADYTAEMAKKIEKTNLDEAMFEVSLMDSIEQVKKGQIVRMAQRAWGTFENKKHRVKRLSGAENKAYKSIPKEEKLTGEDI